MRIIDFSDMNHEDFFAGDLYAFQRKHLFRSHLVNSSRQNGFFLMEEGECRFIWEDREILLQPGTLVYIPLHAHYDMQVSTPAFSISRCNFYLKDALGEAVFFSQSPKLLYQQAPQKIQDLMHEMTRIEIVGKNAARMKLLFYRLINELIQEKETISHHRLTPAISYLHAHYCEEIDASMLAELCFLSPAQFYRMFRKAFDRTPLEYRNDLRMRQAKLLLLEEDYSIGEIAQQLGFESIYYFSRVFRRFTGLSPTAYRKEK